jgi:hypothetical protein
MRDLFRMGYSNGSLLSWPVVIAVMVATQVPIGMALHAWNEKRLPEHKQMRFCADLNISGVGLGVGIKLRAVSDPEIATLVADSTATLSTFYLHDERGSRT